MIRNCIKIASEGEPLKAEDIKKCIEEIMRGEATPAQVGAFLTALHFNKSFQITPEVLWSSAEALLSFAVDCSMKKRSGGVVLDIVGTGGDGLDTFNASTAAAFVVAAAGVTVAKHGNRSASGRCGSADFMEALGADIHLPPATAVESLDTLNYAYLFAQTWHPAMKQVAPIRREIGIRSVFNYLGPLVNPLRPSHILLGVGHPHHAPLYASLAPFINTTRLMVVHSLDGLDEVSVSGPTQVWLVNQGEPVQQWTVTPQDFGVSLHPLQDIVGGDPHANSQTFADILNGAEGAMTDFLILNAAAGLFAAEHVNTLKEGADLARDLLKTGKVKHLVQQYVQFTVLNMSNKIS